MKQAQEQQAAQQRKKEIIEYYLVKTGAMLRFFVV